MVQATKAPNISNAGENAGCECVQAVTEAEAVKAAHADVVQAKQGRVKALKEEVAKLRFTLRNLQSSQRAPASAAAHVLLQALDVATSISESDTVELWAVALSNGHAI